MQNINGKITVLHFVVLQNWSYWHCKRSGAILLCNWL